MGAENRRQHRIGVALEVHIRGRNRFGLAFEETTFSSNVSRGGCSFHTTNQIAPGAELEIEIVRHLAGSQGSFLTTGKVLRAAPLEPGKYQVGVRFLGPHFPTYSSESTT